MKDRPERPSKRERSSASAPNSAPDAKANSDREARLADALRSNLKRRRQQVRARRDPPSPDVSQDPSDSTPDTAQQDDRETAGD